MNREKFFEIAAQRLSAEDLSQVQAAYWLAKEGHRRQNRDAGERYFEHPRSVALILMGCGYVKRDVVVLALLHDVVEDTHIPPSVILNLFGATIWRSLLVLSKKVPALDPLTGFIIGSYRKSDEEYYSGLADGRITEKLVKSADRLHNLRSMNIWTPERQRSYADETLKKILPIAKKANTKIAHEMESIAKGVLEGGG